MLYSMKKVVWNLLFIFVFLHFIPSGQKLYSQDYGSLKGIIKDSVNGESVPYAIIQLEGTKLGTNANVNGFYFLNNIPAGRVLVVLSAVGYQKKSVFITIAPGEIKQFNFSLLPEPKEMKAVVKTAERIKEVYNTNISVQAITQTEMKIVPMNIEKDLFKTIKIIPGISSTSDITSQFYVRGGGGDQNLILLDNMMIYNPFHALGLFSIFNANSIKVSEVMTGGFRPEFGGRMSSVINIISKDGNSNQYGANIDAGVLSAQGLFEGPLFGGSFITTFRKSYFDGILKKVMGKELPLDFYDFTGKITQPLSAEGKITFNGMLSHDEIINTIQGEPNYYWDNSAFGLNINTFLDNYLTNVSFSASRFKASVDYKDGRQKNESEVTDFFFSSKIEFKAFTHDMFSLGVSFLFPETSYKIYNNSDFYAEKKDNENEINFWLNYKLEQIDNLSIDLGLRNNVSYIFNNAAYAIEPRIGLKLDIFKDFSLKGSYSRYNQYMMTTSNEDDVIPLFESWLVIREPYLPERCDEYIAGFDFMPIESSSIKLLVYYKDMQNLLGYNLDKTSDDDLDFYAGRAISYGMEAGVKYQTEDFYFSLNYTLSWTRERMKKLIFSPRYDKTHIMNLMMVYKLPYDISMNLHWEINSGSPFTPIIGYLDKLTNENVGNSLYDNGSRYALMGTKNSARLTWYHKLDIGFTRSFIFLRTKMNATLDINNVYDNKNIFYYNKESGEAMYMLPFLPTFSIGIEL
jgi:hypothetical protein